MASLSTHGRPWLAKRSIIVRGSRRLVAYGLGMAKRDFRRGRITRAFRTLDFAAQLCPSLTVINVVRARLALMAGQPHLLERAVDAAGSLPMAKVSWTIRLARCQLRLDDLQGARSTLASSISRFPGSWMVRRLLGHINTRLASRDEAVHCFRQAIHLAPTPRTRLTAMYELADCLDEFGCNAEAIAVCSEIIERAPMDTLARFTLVTSQADLNADSECAQSLIGLARSSSLATMERQHLHYALGCLNDRSDRPAEAMAHFHTANQIRAARAKPTDLTGFKYSVKRRREIFNREFITNLQMYGSPDESQIFVVGMPRSGTTLVEQILSMHSTVRGLGERQDVFRITQQLQREVTSTQPYPESAKSLSPDVIRGLSHMLLSRRQRDAGPCARIVSKLPDDVWELGLIAILFPKARIIHCQRHPIDTCLSCYMQNFHFVEYATSLYSLAEVYELYAAITEHWREVLVNSPIHYVSYEELVMRPEQSIRDLCSFCKIQFEESCLRFHEQIKQVRTSSRWQVRRPFYQTSIRRWERYRDFLGPLLRLEELSSTLAAGPIST
jgi:Flp pilus assembly protein TadD